MILSINGIRNLVNLSSLTNSQCFVAWRHGLQNPTLVLVEKSRLPSKPHDRHPLGNIAGCHITMFDRIPYIFESAPFSSQLLLVYSGVCGFFFTNTAKRRELLSWGTSPRLISFRRKRDWISCYKPAYHPIVLVYLRKINLGNPYESKYLLRRYKLPANCTPTVIT